MCNKQFLKTNSNIFLRNYLIRIVLSRKCKLLDSSLKEYLISNKEVIDKEIRFVNFFHTF